MKQLEIKEITLEGNRYYVRPFPAMKAAGMSGELFSILGPILGSVLPMIVGAGNVLDMNVEGLAGALSSLSGDKVERIVGELLVKHGNVSVEQEDGRTVRLTEDLANEMFCGEVHNMFLLAFEVIKENYAGFFEKVLPLSGPGKRDKQGKTKSA